MVVYIESRCKRSYEEGNSDRDALEYFLRERCGCEVLLYEDGEDFKKDILRLKKRSDRNLILLVIVREEQYCDQHGEVIRFTRENLSQKLPIVVFPNWRIERPFNGTPGDESVYVFRHTDPGLTAFVESLMAEWRPAARGWLGAESEED